MQPTPPSEQLVSSSITGLFQVLLGMAWILLATVIVCSTNDFFTGAVGTLLLFAFGWGYFAFIWPLRVVYASDHGLRIATREGFVYVHYDEIRSVSRVLRRWDTVEIVFTEAKPIIGPSVMFMAPQRFFWGGAPPAMEMLLEKAATPPSRSRGA
jgi:hypothetical protein